LARDLLAGIADPHDPIAPGEVTPVLYELRGFLVGEQHIDAVVSLVDLVRALQDVDDDVRNELLAACVDEDVLRRLAVAIDPSDVAAVDALSRLAELAPGDHVSTLLELFVDSPKHRSSPVMRRVLEARLRGRAAAVVERMGSLEPEVAVDLFRLVVRADPAGSVDAAITLLSRAEPAAQLESLKVLDSVEYSGKIGRALVGALSSEAADVRLQAVAALVANRERRAFEPIANRVKASSALDGVESTAIGEAMARLDPEKARAVFKEWVRPSGLLGRLGPGQTLFRSVAVAGLALLPGRDSEDLLEWLARHGGDELARKSERALARLRGRSD
jgi:hypothetical protein